MVPLATRLADHVKKVIGAPGVNACPSAEVEMPELRTGTSRPRPELPAARALVVIPGSVNYFNNRLGHRMAESLGALGWLVKVTTLDVVADEEYDWCFLVSVSEIVHGQNNRDQVLRCLRALRRRSSRLALVLRECATGHWAEASYRLARELGIDLYLDLNLLSQAEGVPADLRPAYRFVFNGLTQSERDIVQKNAGAPEERPIPWTFVGLRTSTRARLAHQLVTTVAPDGFLYLPAPREPYTEGSPHLSEEQFWAVLTRSRYQVWCSQFDHFFLEAERFRMSVLTGAVPLKVLLQPSDRSRDIPFSRLLCTPDTLSEQLRYLDFVEVRKAFAEEFLQLPSLEESLGHALTEISSRGRRRHG